MAQSAPFRYNLVMIFARPARGNTPKTLRTILDPIAGESR
jgi:hypothetical protein